MLTASLDDPNSMLAMEDRAWDVKPLGHALVMLCCNYLLLRSRSFLTSRPLSLVGSRMGIIIDQTVAFLETVLKAIMLSSLVSLQILPARSFPSTLLDWGTSRLLA